MNNSKKSVKNIDDLMGKKTFFFPDSLANERFGNELKPCILVRVNGQSHFIFTGQSVELTKQDYAILRDSGMITDNYSYSESKEFDPLHDSYEN
jgi:hypothetical protein